MRVIRESKTLSARADVAFVNQPPRPDAAPELSLAKGSDGVCIFREDRRCAIHTHAGESALPIGCRHYPRVLRIDRSGTALSLSHYCPTAAALLAYDGPVCVVTAAPPLELPDPVEGLDAREALPPLLRPDVLMDVAAYEAWEARAIQLFSATDAPEVALRTLASATDTLREWKPGSVSLEDAVHQAFASAVPLAAPWSERGFAIARSLNLGPVSIGVRRPECHAKDRVVVNYLAARVFGNWIAYQGRGLRTIVTWLQACLDVVSSLAHPDTTEGQEMSIARVIEAVRHADYVMLHTIDSQDFANAAREVEA